MHFTSFTWWTIIVLNIVGYFVFRFGMISHGASKDKIQFIGGVTLFATFPWMFIQYGWWSGIVLILFFWIIATPITEVIIRKINKKLYGPMRSAIDKMTKGMSETDKKRSYDSRYNNMSSEELIDSMMKEYGGRKTISREEMQEVVKKAKNN